MDCMQINECIRKIQSENEFHIIYVRKGEYSTLLLAPILTYIHGVFQRTTHVIHVIYVINGIYETYDIAAYVNMGIKSSIGTSANQLANLKVL